MHFIIPAILAVLVSAPSVAFHGTQSEHAGGGGLPLAFIVPLVIVIVVGFAALGVWGRKKPKGKTARRRARKR